MNLTCAACGASGMRPFYEVSGIPSQTCVLLQSRSEAESFPLGDLTLASCRVCGFIQNARFEAALIDYSLPTEESQGFSPKFQTYLAELAESLVRAHHLEGKSVLEVGCGKGDFLFELGQRGIKHGLGIDPGFLSERRAFHGGHIEFVRDWYGSDSVEMTADLVVSRHLMEHVPNVAEFLGWLAKSTAGSAEASLFTEVPDTLRVLREGAFWDIYYEHCSYFTPGSLARALAAANLEVKDIRLGFEDQYVLATAVIGQGAPPGSIDTRQEVESAVEVFSSLAEESISRWQQIVGDEIDKGDRVAVWGGGSKAVAFLSTIGFTDVTVVDINPYKQGKWLPALGVEVSNPEVLREAPPDLVIAMNAAYLNEIRTDLVGMKLSPRLMAV